MTDKTRGAPRAPSAPEARPKAAARVRLLCGSNRSARPGRIDDLLRAQWGRALLLVPTRRYARARAEQVILEAGLPGAWDAPVLTFEDFVTRLLRSAGRRPVLIRSFERRLLLEQALATLDPAGPLARLGDAASSNGFISHMLRVITELKQAAVEPAAFRERVEHRTPPNSLDAVVAGAYAAYQEALRAAGVYDVPGLYWEADLVCRSGRPPLLDGIDVLLLDAFDDFTPSEFQLLTSLAPYLELLVFGINCDTHPDRQNVYAVPWRTSQRIREHWGADFEAFEEPPPETQAEFAARHIFWRDRPPEPGALRPDLELAPGADFVQEIESVGREVKKLLRDGTPPGEIAIVFRSLREAAGTVRAVFAEFGIPLRMPRQPMLWESASAAFLLNLLDAVGEWSREAVAGVLASPWFMPGMPHRDTVPVLARYAQVVKGLQEWRTRLSELRQRLAADSGDDIETLRSRMPQANEALAALGARLDALETAASLLRAEASPRAHAESLIALLRHLDLDAAAAAFPDADTRDRETRAIATLRGLLHQWGRIESPEPLLQTRAVFVARLREALQETGFPCSQPRDGVLCLDAEEARGLRFDYVFLAGASEGQLPRPPDANALYSEQDIKALVEAGIPIEGRSVHAEREMLLFVHALLGARKRLRLSWHGLSRSGKEVYPSPFITDVKALFPEGAFEHALPRRAGLVPEVEHAACRRDLLNALFLRYPAVEKHLGALGEPFASLRAGAALELERHDTRPCGVYDGVLRDRDLIDRLERQYGPDHLFSVSQLETYAKCPFRFFAEFVLGIESVERPAEEFDARVRGSILHDVLQAFHAKYRQLPWSKISSDEALERLPALVEDAFSAHGWRSKTAPAGVAAVERDRMEHLLRRYVEIERNRKDERWRPTHFEVAFGPTRRPTGGELSNPEPYLFKTPAGTVRFAGRIDRIDYLEQDGVVKARIIDYKSGRLPELKDIKEGRVLQLTVYALALRQYLAPGTPCAEARYIRPGYHKDRIVFGGKSKATLTQLEDTAVSKVAECVKGIRAGAFPPTPADGDCSYCRMSRLCRYEEGRLERKSQAP